LFRQFARNSVGGSFCTASIAGRGRLPGDCRNFVSQSKLLCETKLPEIFDRRGRLHKREVLFTSQRGEGKLHRLSKIPPPSHHFRPAPRARGHLPVLKCCPKIIKDLASRSAGPGARGWAALEDLAPQAGARMPRARPSRDRGVIALSRRPQAGRRGASPPRSTPAIPAQSS